MSAPGEPRHLLDPELPYAMGPRIEAGIADQQRQRFVHGTTRRKDRVRRETVAEAFGDRHQELRKLAGQVRHRTLDQLDQHLERYIAAAEARGIQVHYARDAAAARDIGLRIAKDEGIQRCVKTKSMVTEEIRILEALEAVGIDTVETDLGEFILQLDGDAPSHIVTPMIHKDRTAVGRAFARELGVEYSEDPQVLTSIARRHLRDKYRQADLGISGANFLVAETGEMVLCTNEGNGDFVVNAPRVHIAFVGIEKVLRDQRDLGLMLKLLARTSTGQPLTVYTTFVGGPRQPEDPDGPEQVHLILLDNGRSEILAEETRELLRCIRCGACLNACPVFRKVGGGHAYGAVYSGPIGAAITPLFRGIANYPDLPKASSLCGACHEACPVDIDIPVQLVRLREAAVRSGVGSRVSRMVYRLWARALGNRRTYGLMSWMQRLVMRSLGRRGTRGQRWLRRGLGGWTKVRDFRAPAARSFRDQWRRREEAGGNG